MTDLHYAKENTHIPSWANAFCIAQLFFWRCNTQQFRFNEIKSWLSAQAASAPFWLAKELDTQPWLLAPLCLYAAHTLSTAQLNRLCQQYPTIDAEFTKPPFLSQPIASLPPALETLDSMNAYRKCWNSYVSVRVIYGGRDSSRQLSEIEPI